MTTLIIPLEDETQNNALTDAVVEAMKNGAKSRHHRSHNPDALRTTFVLEHVTDEDAAAIQAASSEVVARAAKAKPVKKTDA